jgi:hypothetical protein
MDPDIAWRLGVVGVGVVPYGLRWLVSPARDTFQHVDIAALASIVVIGVVAMANGWAKHTVFSCL